MTFDLEDRRKEVIAAGNDISKTVDLDTQFMSDWTTETMVGWLRAVGPLLEATDKLKEETWGILRITNAISEELQNEVFKGEKKVIHQEKAEDMKVEKLPPPEPKPKAEKVKKEKVAKPKKEKVAKKADVAERSREKDPFGFSIGTKPNVAVSMLMSGKTMADVKTKLGTEYYLVLKKAKELGYLVEKRADGTYNIAKQVG